MTPGERENKPGAGRDPDATAPLHAHDPDGPTLVGDSGVAGSTEPAFETIGSTIGPYTLTQRLGMGGFGEVYLAEQREPVRREVALKIIKLGMDTREVIARFEAERQTLAQLDHPGVARVLDAGATATGRPYFVMDLVRGEPIGEYCDTRRLDIRARLALFRAVCDAIQHAHNKGIIHRDIKPNNVLVEEIDGRPTPKVIDFGIAKATGPDQRGHSLVTQSGQMIGTPAYMSPEQTGVDGVDVDTRTDVYALGVLLYELVTGVTPFDAEALRTAGFAEMQRIVRERTPARPSTRLSEVGDTATSLAASRGADPDRLRSLLRGDLDWIVMKAIEKDRERRYSTVNGFSMDVGRFLANQPVEARPPSRVYAMRKFVRRNRVGVAAAGVALAAIVAGGVLATAGFVRASAERDRAVAAEIEAESNYRLARSAVDRYLTNVSESAELQAYGLEEFRRSLLDTAREFYQELAASESAAAEAQVETAVAWDRLGSISRLVGDYRAARDAFTNAAALFAQSPAATPSEQAERDRQRAASIGNLALAQSELGLADEATRSFEEAAAIEARLVEADPGNDFLRAQQARNLDNYAQMLERQGDPAAAEAAYARSTEIRRELAESAPDRIDHRFDYMQACVNLGALYARTGRLDEARAQLAVAIEIAESVVAEATRTPVYRHGLAAALGNLAGVAMLQGDFTEAASLYARELAARERLVTDHPNNLVYRLQLGSSYTNLGELEARQEAYGKAVPMLERAVETLDWVLEREPRHATGRFFQSYTLAWLARSLDALGRSAEAVPVWERAIELDDRDDPSLREGLERSRERAA